MTGRSLLIIAVAALLTTCGDPVPQKALKPYLSCDGFFEGEVYQVAYRDSLNRDMGPVVDSALRVLSSLFSMNDPNSTLYRINAGDTLAPLEGLFMSGIYNVTMQHKLTSGRFNPFLYAVCERWGLGAEKIQPGWRSPQKDELDSLLKMCDPSLFCFVNAKDPLRTRNNIMELDRGGEQINVMELYTSKPGSCKLDLRGCMRGLVVYFISDILEMEDVSNYCIQVGQVCYASCEMMPGKLWTVGIEQPDMREPLTTLLKLELADEQAIATAGFNKSVVSLPDGDFFPFVNPASGERIPSGFYSYSVIADYAIEADAWATVFLSLGKDSAFRLAKENNLELIYIYRDEKKEFKWEATEGIKKSLITGQ